MKHAREAPGPSCQDLGTEHVPSLLALWDLSAKSWSLPAAFYRARQQVPIGLSLRKES